MLYTITYYNNLNVYHNTEKRRRTNFRTMSETKYEADKCCCSEP